jgi:hypothetical protein
MDEGQSVGLGDRVAGVGAHPGIDLAARCSTASACLILRMIAVWRRGQLFWGV